MVWVAKNVTDNNDFKEDGRELTKLSYTVPKTFNTTMTLDAQKKQINFKFPLVSNDKPSVDLLKKFGSKLQKSDWNPIAKVAEDFKSMTLNVDFKTSPKFDVSRIKVTDTELYKTLEVKIVDTTSKSNAAIFVNFDFGKSGKNTVADGLETVLSFFKTNWPKANA